MLADVPHKGEAYARQMDKLGYHSFWMAEHHCNTPLVQ